MTPAPQQPPGTSTIFTPAKRDALRACYQSALAEQAPTFEFEGHQLDTNYAAYLLLYLDAKLTKDPHP